jgi:hypothetical protein
MQLWNNHDANFVQKDTSREVTIVTPVALFQFQDTTVHQEVREQCITRESVLTMAGLQAPIDTSHRKLARTQTDTNAPYPKEILWYSGGAFVVGGFGWLGMLSLLSALSDFTLGLVFVLALLIFAATLLLVKRSLRAKRIYDAVTGTKHHGWRDVLMAVFNVAGLIGASIALIIAFWLFGAAL